MECHNCKADNRDGAAFCKKCGAGLAGQQAGRAIDYRHGDSHTVIGIIAILMSLDTFIWFFGGSGFFGLWQHKVILVAMTAYSSGLVLFLSFFCTKEPLRIIAMVLAGVAMVFNVLLRFESFQSLVY